MCDSLIHLDAMQVGFENYHRFYRYGVLGYSLFPDGFHVPCP